MAAAEPAAERTRGKLLTSASSAASWAESQGGGGPGRNSLPLESTHVLQVPARASTGFVPFQLQGPFGMLPPKIASDPSDCARAITRAAINRPKSRPACTSLGYCTPARSRDVPAAAACSANVCASVGNKYARTVDAAPAATACSLGYEGLSGLGIAVLRLFTRSLGRGRL